MISTWHQFDATVSSRLQNKMFIGIHLEPWYKLGVDLLSASYIRYSHGTMDHAVMAFDEL